MAAALEMRWRAARAALQAVIVDQDILGLRSPSFLSFAPVNPLQAGAGRVLGFQRYVDLLLQQTILNDNGAGMRIYIEQAAALARARAEKLIGRSSELPTLNDRVSLLVTLSVTELQGIMEAVSQQVVRTLAQGLLAKATAPALSRQVMKIIDQVGTVRSRALAEVIIVRTHSEVTLDVFEAAAIKLVGLVPEARPASRRVGDSVTDARGLPSGRTIGRIQSREALLTALGEVNVLTAGDNDVCPQCQDIADGGPYDIDTARSLIPAHPWCRCAFVPSDDLRFAEPDLNLE